DFKAAERDGWEISGPISYKDIEPYYDKVDQLIGVCGGDDDSDVLPGSKYHLPPPNLRCGEVLLKKAATRSGIPVDPALKTGRLEIRNNAVVARILVDKNGKASGVQYFDRESKQEYQVRGR